MKPGSGRAVGTEAMNSQQPSRSPGGRKSPLWSDVVGLQHFAISDSFGNIVESSGVTDSTEVELYAGQLAINSIKDAASLLGLGSISFISVKHPTGTKLVTLRNGYTLAIALTTEQSMAVLEAQIALDDWIPEEEEVIDSEDIIYVASRHGVSQVELSSIAPVSSAEPPRNSSVVPPSIPVVRVPPRPGPVVSPTLNAVNQTLLERTKRQGVNRLRSQQESNTAALDVKHLRRVIERGDISSITKIAERLRDNPTPTSNTSETGVSAPAIFPLCSAISSILAGENQVGIRALDALGQQRDIGNTLVWATLFWSARASIGLLEGLESAQVYAESAARVAKKLDVETRASSNHLLAEVCYYRRDAKGAERYIELAKRLLETVDDNDSLAELLLLRAKVALLDESIETAIAAAQDAQSRRVDWLAPAVFLCRCALARADVQGARELVTRIVAVDACSPEVSRLDDLVKAVEANAIFSSVAAEFLLLDESPPSRSNVGRLEVLVENHPQQFAFANSLGWKYLKVGNLNAAKRIFERLGNTHELPDDVRSSVLLAIGYLESVSVTSRRDARRLQALVDAAPQHLKSDRPPRLPSSHYKAAKPVDLFDLAPPPSSLAYGTVNLPKLVSDTPPAPNRVFSGNLAIFALPDLLEFLRAGRRTGTLVCSSTKGLGAMQLVEGRLTGAAAPGTPKFQELVLEAGLVTSKTLNAVLENETRTGSTVPLGTLLVKSGQLTSSQHEQLFMKQITLAVTEMLHWTEGYFAFEPENPPHNTCSALEVSLDPQTVLLEIFKSFDENKR